VDEKYLLGKPGRIEKMFIGTPHYRRTNGEVANAIIVGWPTEPLTTDH
jgi:hypothetical protein